ncbi:hypothetical protein HK099_003484 [Clydaea vesicula]|uniref:Hydrocephalus-inducing protein n=1 Tax=Clydaea vesicula TaxID=447962 RepID=A0AAD5U666_9FUNG|nr:hypothetical protein HK099_003484 [Clydaea vesicula]
MKTQKIKYKLPKTKFFSVEFPENITLSAGMSWTIPITFRPVSKECYYDVIEFQTSFGKFNVQIHATLPEHVLEFQKLIDFEFCPIKETAKKTFLLKNTGELGSYYEFEIQKPFYIVNKKGFLEPNYSTNMTIEFKPDNASVFKAKAICKFGDSSNLTRAKGIKALNVNGIGKYSHISIEGYVKEFDFGEVFVGKYAEKKLILNNFSAVRSNFKIKQVEKNSDQYFVFSQTSGSIAPEKKIEITITYTPVAAGMICTDFFDIITLSGNTIRITCKGAGIGPTVSFTSSIINFNDVPENTTVMRALHIHNHSATTAFFQFLTEPNSTFKIDKISGTINPNSSLPLTIKFQPKEALNYYRRVYCLVENQDAIVLDLLGTGYNDKRRPATFLPRHLEAYETRVKNGLAIFGPEQLEEMIKSSIIKSENGLLSYIDETQRGPKAEVYDSPYEDSQLASEYFYQSTATNLSVCLMDTFIDFGSCSRYRVIESQTIRITNRTKGKMACVWILPGDNEEEAPFTVHPRVGDILPKCTAEFKVNFRPKADNSFYGQQLECYVYFKSMRSFRLVTNETFTPPWCLTPTVLGNTFPPGQDSFIPKVNINSDRIDFPACYVDKSVYRTIRITNTGDTPVMFSFLDDTTGNGIYHSSKNIDSIGSLNYQTIGGSVLPSSSGGPVFSVKPRVGMLQKNECQLIVFRFSPGEAGIFDQTLQIFFNGSFTNSYKVQVRGVGYFPLIEFEDYHSSDAENGGLVPYSGFGNNSICFKPTCIGSAAKKNFIIKNLSRISVNYEWAVPKQYESFVYIYPVRGTLAPNGVESLSCTFAPTFAKSWAIRIPCYYNHQNEELAGQTTNIVPSILSPHTQRRATFTVMGLGVFGKISTEIKNNLDFGPCLVNTIVEKEIRIFNPCECDVYFKVEAKSANSRQSLFLPKSSKNDELEIVQSSNMLPARSHQNLKIKCCLKNSGEHNFIISYILESPVNFDHAPNIQSRLLKENSKPTVTSYTLFEVKATGVFRSMEVTDIRSEGLGKKRLWELFSLEKFNNIIRNIIPDVIHEHNNNDSLFPTEPRIDVDAISKNNEAVLDFDFGAKPIGVVLLKLKNNGVVAVDWSFQFPNDLEIEIEQWADPGDYTEEQLHYDLILENAIFKINPKMGVLAPNDLVTITVTYSHEFNGTHKIPVLFRLRSGNTSTVSQKDEQINDISLINENYSTTIKEGGGGKEILINFLGHTVSPNKKYLHFHGSEHKFIPSNIGNSHHPVQLYPLYNCCSVSVEYTLDLSGLEQVKKENRDFPVFQCLKTKGTISAGEIDYVDWIFRPLEEKIYTVDVPITIEGKTRIITFSGEGIRETIKSNTKLDAKILPHPVPPIQLIKSETDVAELSLERINFGHIPLGATVRQIVIVKNVSNDLLSFQWSLPSSNLNFFSNIKVVPEKGSLEPGKSSVCKVELISTVEARYYDFDIVCKIENETKMAVYQTKKEAAEYARRENRPLSGGSSKVEQKVSTLVKSKRKSQHDLKNMKYRTLPPITPPPAFPTKNKLFDEENSISNNPVQDGRSSGFSMYSDNSFDFLPPAPEICELSLGILAQSHSIDEIAQNYTNYETFFHQKKSYFVDPNDTSDLFSNQECQEIINNVLLSALDDIMADSELEKVLEQIQKEPLMYFRQLSVNEHDKDSINGIFVENCKLDTEIELERNEMENLEQLKNHTYKAMMRSSEFINLVESILEGTVFNLLQEVNVNEFELTRPCKLAIPYTHSQ